MSGKRKKKATKKDGPVSRVGRYVRLSRSLAASYVFIVPLLAAHQVGLMAYPDARNGTTPIYEELFHKVHWIGAVVLNLLLLSMLCFAIFRTRDERRHVRGMYAWMFFESTVWAASLYVIAIVTRPLFLALPEVGRNLTIAVGAGIFEEFLFRFLLLGGIGMLLIRGLGAPRTGALTVALVLSSVVFSFAHHAASGIGNEEWNLGIFLLRTFLGALLGALYCWRGLGVVVYTHALYNVAVFH